MHQKLSALPYHRKSIRNQIYSIKQTLGLLQNNYIDIVRFIELALPKIDPDFYLDIVPNSYFKDRYAEACPSQHTIRVTQRVYENAIKKNPYYRIIMAHELGHYLMHSDKNICFAYAVDKNCNIERQADIFSSEFLINYNFAKSHSAKEIAKQCVVPFKEAKRYKHYVTIEAKLYKKSMRNNKKKKKAGHSKYRAD